MENTIENLMGCLVDSLEYIHNIKMREHIKTQVRMAQETLDYAKLRKLEAELQN